MNLTLLIVVILRLLLVGLPLGVARIVSPLRSYNRQKGEANAVFQPVAVRGCSV